MPDYPTFHTLREKLEKELSSLRGEKNHYYVPAQWLPGGAKPSRIVKIDPAEFFLHALSQIDRTVESPVPRGPQGTWTKQAVIYNMFLRTTAAFDHNQNSKLDLPVNSEGWRETGSFFKALAMLPYVRSLGANTVHLLPITSIGSDGNKGTLGSPYAIRNPYVLDEHLREPRIGLDAEDQFRLFVEAAHRLGMRVVVEFVFRTSAKNSDWVKEHPEWFYWINADVKDREVQSQDESCYGNPIFSEKELHDILSMVEQGKFDRLPPPHIPYREMFTRPPEARTIREQNGRFIGQLDDGTRVRIPGAFADWPPHDTQPPWGDVTYLRMYDHPDFNYIAYNTIRMYDARLASKEHINASLWETISEIIPYYQRSFGIDGVLIDMGHALPMDLKREIIHRARSIDPEFAFWDENFSVTQQSVDEEYNAVIGYQWSDQHKPEQFKNLLRRFSQEGYPIAFFATPESHNTPRAAARDGGLIYSKYSWAVSNFIPAVPFIHSGFELGETFPINTGLDFTREEVSELPSEKLPLFSEYAFDWCRDDDIIEWIRNVSAIRKKYETILLDSSRESFHWIESENPDVIVFVRGWASGSPRLLIIANSSMRHATEVSIQVETRNKSLDDVLSKKSIALKDHSLCCELSAGEVMVFKV